MVELNIESIGADWCIDDIIKVVLDENPGLFLTSTITIPENKLPHLKGALTIDNTTVNLSEAYSLEEIIKNSSGSETYYHCNFVGNELPKIVGNELPKIVVNELPKIVGNELPKIEIVLDSSFRPIQALINNNSGSGGIETE